MDTRYTIYMIHLIAKSCFQFSCITEISSCCRCSRFIREPDNNCLVTKIHIQKREGRQRQSVCVCVHTQF